jgi:type VI protein secretion system component VasK
MQKLIISIIFMILSLVTIYTTIPFMDKSKWTSLEILASSIVIYGLVPLIYLVSICLGIYLGRKDRDDNQDQVNGGKHGK